MLKLERIIKSFDGIKILDDLNFEIPKGQIVSILGPSGSGKTTLLNLILGISEVDSGKIIFDDEDLTNVSMEKRGFNIVFQDYALFPNLNAYENIIYGLKNKKNISTKEEVNDLIHLLGLEKHLDKKIDQLSGGQKQRVAIAGIIALRPEIIILDEATSMLDPTGRAEIMRVIREIKAEYNLTVLSITHDLDEATLSDRVLVMRAGKIIKSAKPEELFGSGEDMINIGLDMPFTSNLAEDLRADFNLPEKYLNEEELAELLAERLRK